MGRGRGRAGQLVELVHGLALRRAELLGDVDVEAVVLVEADEGLHRVLVVQHAERRVHRVGLLAEESTESSGTSESIDWPRILATQKNLA